MTSFRKGSFDNFLGFHFRALQGAPCSGASIETDGCFPQECPGK